MLFPATPGWGPLVVAGGVALRQSLLRSAGVWGVVVAGGPSPLLAEGPWLGLPRHSWLRAPGAVPCHSWLGSASRGGGRFCGVWWGVSRVVCICGAARARAVCAGVCVVCSWCLWWWWCRCGCVFRVCFCVCVCVCGLLAVCGCWSLLPPGSGLLVVLVWVWLVCAVVGPLPLLAEVPVCDSPLILAGFRGRWWWAFLATPG